MNVKILLLCLLFMSACTVKTQIIEPDGSIYTIVSKSDAKVIMKNANREIVVDNKGKPNIFESLLGWLLLKTPNVN
ncbi:hypothetical protein KAR91_63280 [Candidatus Pacearchaeota archaeon]|nr:hypothetical protein [Candidatus Pacearchaeota archaeon]